MEFFWGARELEGWGSSSAASQIHVCHKDTQSFFGAGLARSSFTIRSCRICLRAFPRKSVVLLCTRTYRDPSIRASRGPKDAPKSHIPHSKED